MESSEQHEHSEIQRESTFEHHGITVATSAIQSIKIQNDSAFYCLPCASRFMNNSEFTLHLKSGEHVLMILATGFDYSEPFPPLYSCMLCNINCFDSNSYINHFKGKFHKRMAHHMKNKSEEGKQQIVVGGACICTSKRLSDPYAPLHYCELCDFWFDSCKSFNQHIKCRSHKIMGLFVVRMGSLSMMEILGICSEAEISENDSESLSDYCHLCNIQCNGHKSYKHHFRGRIHKKSKQLIAKLSEERGETRISVCLGNIFSENFENSLHLLKYCEFCRIWFKSSKRYDDHLKTAFHRKIKMPNILIHDRDSSYETQTSEGLVSFSPPEYHCKSCNIVFSESEYFDQHLKSAIHTRIEQFIIKMSNTKEKNIASVSCNNSDNFTSSLPLLQYCELCNSFSKADSCDHLKNNVHKIIETYISKFNCKKDRPSENIQDSLFQSYCCELCNTRVWELSSYNQHLQGKFHKRMNLSLNRISKKDKREKKLK